MCVCVCVCPCREVGVCVLGVREGGEKEKAEDGG